MILRAIHSTTYLYSAPVSLCHTEVHLAPRENQAQKTLSHELTITPEPSFSISRNDYFGNQMTCFSIHEPHRTLTIESRSQIDLRPEEPPHAGLTPAWEKVREETGLRATEETFRASEFVFRSPFVKITPEFAEWARPSFAPGRSILEAGFDLCHRIASDFKYDPRATTISTPVDEVLRLRRGVCQDFAHLMISCARSMGLPARYISGYLRSGETTFGAEASHAWCALFCPGFGWLEFDPTNDVMPQKNHVTIAWGRDYSDVAPVTGVALGGGEQIINVSVDVRPG
jgi:transglutaminase-like putative cysteine protease